jgi:hypothetical protein
MLTSVEVSGGGAKFQASVPKPLFAVYSLRYLVGGWHWDVTADGQRFLVVTDPETANGDPITVVLNWSGSGVAK